MSCDITHCLQQPSMQRADGTVCAGGLREFIPLMAKIALVSEVDALFMEVHDDPPNSLCDAPTQFYLNKLESFLNELSLVGSSIITEHEAEQQKNQETLTLTTIHQAKGLEWNVVIVIGLTEGLFPHQRSLETEEQIEEERRLFYVAMTRAKRHLHITAPVFSSGYSGGISKRSRFINELSEETINTEIHTRDEYSYGSRRGQTQFYF